MPSESVRIRAWRPPDEETLATIANDHRIWRNLTNAFPHPYMREDAAAWIAGCNADPQNARHFAVLSGTEVVGGVGYQRQSDLLTRTAEIGYWLGTSFWGRGIASSALRLATEDAFRDFDFVRLQAGVLSWNPASCRVLEKAGYTREGLLRQQAFKDGAVCDMWMYSLLREEHR